MRTEQLEYVAAIARLGSFRRAAEELHISQPALSATVRNLEQELRVSILERGRSGTQVSDEGRDLLPRIIEAIEAIDRLRAAADDQHRSSRVIRVATVNAGTVPVLTPTAGAFRALHPDTRVELIGAQEAEINSGLLEGRFDLGLLTAFAGDDPHPELETVTLVRGHPVVCIRTDSPLARLKTVSVKQLLSEPMVLMRSGYLMHRYVHRLFRGHEPAVYYTTDGGEMGKLLVAEGLGVTILPDFSISGDPLVRAKVITWRPLADEDTEVHLTLQRRRSAVHPVAARDLHRLFLERSGDYELAQAS